MRRTLLGPSLAPVSPCFQQDILPGESELNVGVEIISIQDSDLFDELIIGNVALLIIGFVERDQTMRTTLRNQG